MSAGKRFRPGVRILRITRGGDLYRVELQGGDYFFLSEVEKWELDSLRPGESLGVSDLGRVFTIWNEKGRLIAYERAPE